VKKIIVINGSSNSGKDTFVKYFNSMTDIAVFNHSTIDNVREMFVKLGYKNERMIVEYRSLMCEIKKFLVKYDNIPFKDMVKDYERYNSCMNSFVLFIHSREPDEIEQFVNYFNDCVTVLIRRKGIDVPNNSADMGVNDYEYDYIIDNNGTLKQLEEKVRDFIIEMEII